MQLDTRIANLSELWWLRPPEKDPTDRLIEGFKIGQSIAAAREQRRQFDELLEIRKAAVTAQQHEVAEGQRSLRDMTKLSEWYGQLRTNPDAPLPELESQRSLIAAERIRSFVLESQRNRNLQKWHDSYVEKMGKMTGSAAVEANRIFMENGGKLSGPLMNYIDQTLQTPQTVDIEGQKYLRQPSGQLVPLQKAPVTEIQSVPITDEKGNVIARAMPTGRGTYVRIPEPRSEWDEPRKIQYRARVNALTQMLNDAMIDEAEYKKRLQALDVEMGVQPSPQATPQSPIGTAEDFDAWLKQRFPK